jgi:hypothetical protein
LAALATAAATPAPFALWITPLIVVFSAELPFRAILREPMIVRGRRVQRLGTWALTWAGS